MPSFVGTAGVVILLLMLFVVAVYRFRLPKTHTDEPIVDSIANVLSPKDNTLPGASLYASDADTAELFSVTSGEELGYAKRGTKNGHYFFEVLSPLPQIDREVFYYEVWLLRPIPYDFFSAGEMVTNDLGQFIVEWEGDEGKKYDGYTHVVITLEKYDGQSGPNLHVAEGEYLNTTK